MTGFDITCNPSPSKPSILLPKDACIKKFGKIDILVNNVGGSAKRGPVEMTEDIWQRQVNFNLTSVYLTCKHILLFMAAQKKGSIVNLTKSGLNITAPDAAEERLMECSRGSRRPNFQ